SENRPPILNKENYVPWSSRLLRYAKSRPNGKLIHKSIINGPYVRRMIPEPGDTNREVPINETFHVQTDDELNDKELIQIEADDQSIQTILLGLPEDIYTAVDSCETAQEIWLRVQQMMKGSDIGIQEKKAKLFNEWEKFTSTDGESIESYYHRFLKLMNDLKRNKHFPERLPIQMVGGNGGNQFRQYGGQNTRNLNGYNDVQNAVNEVFQHAVQNLRIHNVVQGNANQNLNGNGNLVAARTKGNANGHNEADEEEEEEEHSAPADSVVVAPTAADQDPYAEETKPFKTDESAATPPPHPAYRTTARISIPAPVPMTTWTDSEVVRLLAISSPPASPLSPWSLPLLQIPFPPLPPILSPPSPILAPAPPPSPICSLGYRAAMIRLRDEAASTSHSPPSQLLSTSRREDRP
nr:hypothetical protein [Tanacetum cinerariifolium]